ncbi:hypothetical protein ABZX39_32645 [Streptomyces collinus]|uniref:hypothetical protein n=1 Tax=Streptomyces collinus TaxID=42684 RepID=UPI0033B7A74F
MACAPIVVHRPLISGGRRVNLHRHGGDRILGTAYSDHDLVVILESAGIAVPAAILNGRGAAAHEFRVA